MPSLLSLEDDSVAEVIDCSAEEDAKAEEFEGDDEYVGGAFGRICC